MFGIDMWNGYHLIAPFKIVVYPELFAKTVIYDIFRNLQ